MDYRVFSADIIFDDNSIGKEEEEEKETLSLYGFVFRGSGKSPISPLSQASNAKKEKKKISVKYRAGYLKFPLSKIRGFVTLRVRRLHGCCKSVRFRRHSKTITMFSTASLSLLSFSHQFSLVEDRKACIPGRGHKRRESRGEIISEITPSLTKLDSGE